MDLPVQHTAHRKTTHQREGGKKWKQPGNGPERFNYQLLLQWKQERSRSLPLSSQAPFAHLAMTLLVYSTLLGVDPASEVFVG